MATRKRNRDIDQDVEKYVADLVAPNWETKRNLAAFVRTELLKVERFKGRIPGVRALQRLVHGMKVKLDGSSEYVQALDRPFEWHRLEEYELPWEASWYLLRMAHSIQEYEAALDKAMNIGFQEPPPRRPTGRQVKWWWRVHQAVSAVEGAYLNVYIWAEEYVRYELYRDILGREIDVSGVDAYLTYQPWVGEDRLVEYLAAIREGRIPALPDAQAELPLVEELRGRGITVVLSLNRLLNLGEQPIEWIQRYIEQALPLAQEMRTSLRKIAELQNNTDSKEGQS